MNELDDLFSEIDGNKAPDNVTHKSSVKDADKTKDVIDNLLNTEDDLFSKLDNIKDKDVEDESDENDELKENVDKKDVAPSEESEEDDDEDTKFFKKNIVKEEFFQNFLKEKVAEEIKEYEQTFLEGLDDDAKAFFEFKRNGGTLTEFLNERSKVGEVVEKSTDKENQKAFLTQYFELKGLPKSAISSIETLNEVDLIKAYEEAYADYSTIVAQQRQALVEAKAQEANERERMKQENNLKLKNKLKETETLYGISLDTKLKNDMYNFNTKVDPKTNMTPLQSKLVDIFQSGDDRMIKLAYLLSKDLSLDTISKTLGSQVASDTKNKIKEYRKNSGSKTGKKTQTNYASLEALASKL